MWNSKPPKVQSPTEAATMSIDPSIAPIFRWTPTQAETINVTSPGKPFELLVFLIDAVGGSSFTVTFGTNLRSTGTLATGTSTGKRFLVAFMSDGTTWSEFTRTAAQT